MPVGQRHSVWDAVIGQERAVAQLTRAAQSAVHAYMFIGPPGCTKDEAARAFAALLMAGTDDPQHRDARLALAGEHPDVREVRREGASISKEQVQAIIRNAALTPSEGSRKVMILHEFQLLSAELGVVGQIAGARHVALCGLRRLDGRSRRDALGDQHTEHRCAVEVDELDAHAARCNGDEIG